MANDTVIDELSLQIDANASAAIRNLSQMQRQLRNLARDIGSVSSATSSLARLTNTFNKIGNINTSKLDTIAGQLERISNINFKNFDGKRLNLDVKISGADKAEREIYAMQDALKNVDTSPLVKKFNDLFGLKGVDATKIKSVYREAIQDISTGGTGSSAFVDWLRNVEKDGLQIARASFMSDIASMRTEYAEFLKYLQNNKIALTNAVDKKTFNENTNANERMTFFNQQGSALDGRWEELANLFPTIMSGMKDVANEEDQVYAVLEKIREARMALQTVDIKDISGVESDNAWSNLISTVGEAPQELKRLFDQEVQKSMKESASKIPLDISIEPSRIESQIKAAIKQATANPFKLPLEFSFGELKTNLKSTVATTLSGLDVSKLGDLNTGLSAAAESMKEMGGTDPKGSGLTAFVNSINRLTSTDLSKFNLDIFKDIREAIKDFASMEDISASVNRFVSSLARLANAGDKTSTVATTLPKLGAAIRSVMGGLSSMGGLPAELNAFVTSIASLANAGNKTGTTAEHLVTLGENLKTFITDVSQAPEVSNNILQMTTAIAELANAGGKAGSAAKSINKGIGSVADDSGKANGRIKVLTAIMDDLGKVFQKSAGFIKQGASHIVNSLKQLKSAGNGLNGATQSIKNMIGAMIGFRGVQGLVTLSKQVLELGGNITEIDHIVESVFGDMAQYVDTWADNAITNFGIASHSAKQYAGVLSSMFQASGIGYKDAGIMGVRLTELAGDLSAFYNIDTATAFKKVQSGMAGMVRPLRDLGIDLTAATLSEYALAQGITKSYTEMTQAEKVMLRYQYLLSVTERQQGDFQLTALSYANSLRTLKANFAALGTQIGAGLVAAIRPAIVALNTLMKYLVKAATAFATFMKTLFPFKNGSKGFAFDASAMEEDASNLGDAAGGAAEGLDDAADSAKKLRKELSVLPFDELNQLNKDQDSTSSGKGSGGAGGLGGLGGLADDLLDWGDLINDGEAGKLPDAISEWAERIKAAFKAHDWEKLGEELAWGINKGIDYVYDALDPERFKKKVQPFITAFTETFNSLVDHIHWNKLGRTVARGINDLTWALNGIIEGINWENLGSKLAEFANGIVSDIDATTLGNLIGNKFMIAWNMLYGFADRFNWAGLGTKLGDLLNGVNDKISWSKVASAITTSFNGVFETLKNFTERVHWDEIAKNITDGLNKAISSFKWKDNGEALGEFINDLLDTINYIVDNTNWYSFGEGLADMLSELPWARILVTFGKVVVKAIGGTLAGLASTPSGMFATAFLAALVARKTILGTEIGKQFIVPAIKKAFASQGVQSALGEAASAIGGSFVGSLALQFAGTTLAVTGAITGIRLLAKAIEKAQGGNGKLTSMGTALEGYFGKINGVSTNAKEELWAMVQEQEDAGASAEDMANTTIQKLAEMKVPYAEAKGALEEYASQHSLTAQDAQILYDALENNKGMFEQTAESLEGTQSGYDQLRDALYDCAYAAGGDQLGGNYQYLLDILDQSHAHGETSKDALNTIKGAMEDLGLETDILTGKLGNDFGNTSTVVQSHSTDMQSALLNFAKSVQTGVTNAWNSTTQKIQENVSAQKTELGNWQMDVEEFRSGVEEKLKGVGQNWGQLGTDQEQSLSSLNQNLETSIQNQQTAIGNMQTLNESGLDKATVQAILKQIDPSSQAMNDLIAHMNADDATWQQFHQNIETSMDLTGSVDTMLDNMTTEFAKQIAPSFVTVTDDFKVEGNKMGGFLVEGLGSGVQGSVSDAQNALDDLAKKSIKAFNDAAGIHSPSTVMESSGKDLVQGAANGVEGYKSVLRDAMTHMETEVANSFITWTKTFEPMARQIVTYVSNGLRQFKSPFTSAFNEVGQLVAQNRTVFGGYGTTLATDFTTAFKNELTGSGMATEMYNAGAALAQNFASGLQSAYIATPHLYVADYTTVTNSDGSWYSYPNWGVNWYKKGGLFLGGKGTVVGLAEGGKDEAVLPLENSGAMKRIGTAIANAAGDGFGVNSETITDAVVTAMAMNPQSQEVIVNAVLKMENDEVLARHVERGRQRLDSRYNPVAQI